jgi:hypothetical protein
VIDKINIIQPKNCPFPLIRIGGNNDGAYLLPDDLQGIKACFSPGVSNRKDFEDELLDKYGIESHMCDYTSDPEKFKTPIKKGQTFKKKWLDIDGGDDSITLEEWVKELSPNAGDDLILQIDIEGAEYRNLLHTPDEILRRFRIIIIELHNLQVCNRLEDFNKELGPLLQKLDQHFLCVHAHPNNCSGDFQVLGSKLNLPKVHEVTFLRRDRWHGMHESECHPPMLPHPLDIAQNDPNKPPIFLNEYWLLSNKRATESTIKMLQDQVGYLERALKYEKISKHDSLITLHRLTQYAAARIPTTGLEATVDGLIDLAAGKQYQLSSQHAACPHERHVMEKRPFFFHTEEDYNQSITIDLETISILHELRISNRTDGYQHRARCLFYCVHDNPKPNLQQGLPVVMDDGFLAMPHMTSMTDLRGVKAQYVTIFSPEKTFLHLSAVRILGVSNEWP